jgi:hypothetical protein
MEEREIKNVLERFGFKDPDRSTPGHDAKVPRGVVKP